MNKEKLKALSTKELESKEKSLKFLTGLMVGVIGLLLAFTLYDAIVDGKIDQGLYIAVICSFAIPYNYYELKKVKQELATRS